MPRDTRAHVPVAAAIRDLTSSDQIDLTQEFLAQMLGVRRTSVTIHAVALQGGGCIKYSRGRIHLLDIAQLERTSCECYAAVKTHYERLLTV